MSLAFNALQRKTILEVIEWYEFQVETLGREKSRVLAGLYAGALSADDRFFAMDAGDVEAFFGLQRDELDFVTMLDVMSAAEASLRLDYIKRVAERLKDPVSRCFRAIHKGLASRNRRDKVILEDHILNTWASTAPAAQDPVRDFKGAMPLRHWLAHGRHWDPQMGRQEYSPGDVYDISRRVLEATVDAP